MKKIILSLITLVALTSCQKEQKIAYVDNAKLVNEYQGKIDAEAALQIKEQAYVKKRDSIRSVFQLEVQAFQAESKTLSEAKLQEKYQEYGQKQQMIKQGEQMQEQRLTQLYQIELDSIIKKLKGFVQGYGEKNGYTYILGTTDATSSIMYGSEQNDISQAVLDALNEDYKKGSAAAETTEDTAVVEEVEAPAEEVTKE